MYRAGKDHISLSRSDELQTHNHAKCTRTESCGLVDHPVKACRVASVLASMLLSPHRIDKFPPLHNQAVVLL